MRPRTRRTLTQYLVSEPSTRRRRTAHRVRFGPLSRFRAPKAHSPWAISLRITRFDRRLLFGLCSLAEPFDDERAPHAARVSASQAILDRAYGKAPTLSTRTQQLKRAIDMTDDELAAIASGATLHVVK